MDQWKKICVAFNVSHDDSPGETQFSLLPRTYPQRVATFLLPAVVVLLGPPIAWVIGFSL